MSEHFFLSRLFFLGVGVGVLTGAVLVAIGAVGVVFGCAELLRLMLTSTTTARITASSSMPPKISCQRELLAARSPAAEPGSVLALVAGTRSLCFTRRVPQ